MHPEAASLEDDLTYLKTKVDAGASFLITQLFFDNEVYWSFVGGRSRARHRRADHPGRHPDRELRPGRSHLLALRRDDPGRAGLGAERMGGDLEAEALLGVAYASRQCEELLAGGAPGIHFYALNRAPGTRAVLSALRASRPWERLRERVGARA